MSAKYFYFEPHLMPRNSEITNNSDDDDDEVDKDFEDFVPYYSSSVDRSSISSSIRSASSIPWAEDAIKKNQMDWEHVERMLRNEEEPNGPAELRQEILEWQQKFPILLQGQPKTPLLVETTTSREDDSYNTDKAFGETDNTLNNMESLSIISFSSQENDEGYNIYDKYDEANITQTPTNQKSMPKNSTAPHIRRQQKNQLERIKTSSSDIRESLADIIEKDLHISSVPLQLGYRNPNNNNTSHSSYSNNKRYAHQRREAFANSNRRTTSSSTTNSANNSFAFQTPFSLQRNRVNSAMNRSSYVNANLGVPDAPKNTFNLNSRRRTQMPPILNVLESKRSFLALPNSRNRSFVQLTNVPKQVKSAAVLLSERDMGPVDSGMQPQPERRNSNKSTWYVPFITASVNKRFQNNRNAIILPSLNATHTSAKTQNSNSSATGVPWRQHQQHAYGSHVYQDLIQHTTTGTSTSGTVPSTGRSISSAMTTTGRNPRIRYATLYNL